MNRLMERIGALVAGLPPAYFALVMSTGIVSIACHLLGFDLPARLLFWLNLGLYPFLGLLTILRLLLYPRQFLEDLRSPARGPGFFTLVAGTCILGSQVVIIMAAERWGVVLFFLGLGLWLFFMYALLAALAGGAVKPALTASLSGLWLVAPVSTQSLAILACLTLSQYPAHREELLFFSLCLFLVGGLLSLILVSLIFYRLIFLPLDPRDFDPSYWINMGVNAIGALAGANLLASSPASQAVAALHHVLVILTICFWAAATWWLPFLISMMVWRHLIRGVEFCYTPSYWGLVFPLGMYATCTLYLAKIIDLPFLAELAGGCLYAALAAWLLTFLGLLRSLLRSLARGLEISNPASRLS